MSTADVKLLGTWACPYVNRAQLALTLKSVEHEFIEDLPYKKSELLLKTNPVHKKIPVLIHNDQPVCESLVIVQYIDDAWTGGPSLLPSGAYDRALARFWAAYIDDKWYPLVKVLREAEEKESRIELKRKISEGLVLLEEAFVKCSKGKTFFGGDNVGYLDIVLGSTLGWLRVTEQVVDMKLLDETKMPSLAQWAMKFCSDSAVKDVIPGTDKLLDLYKQILAFKKANSA